MIDPATPEQRPSGRVVSRTVAVLDLELLGPAHFGGGEGDSTDATVLLDGHGEPFIPGSTLAGAARSHLRALLRPGQTDEADRLRVEGVLGMLFGATPTPTEGDQSALIVDDAYPAEDGPRPAIEQRDSVAIDPERRTATNQAKFDYEVLVRGAVFRTRCVLEVRDSDRSDAKLLRQTFALLLRELQAGRVRDGAMIGSGFGRLRATLVGLGDQDLLAWLRGADPTTVDPCWQQLIDQPGPAFDERLQGRYRLVRLRVGFRARGPLLIRSAPAEAHAPDAVQLRSGGRPVAPGTSLRGVLRATARRVALTLAQQLPPVDRAVDEAQRLVQELFGPEHELIADQEAKPWAGLLRVEEAVLDDTTAYEQTRTRIDRVTQGVLDGYLFTERPEYPTTVEASPALKPNLILELEVRNWQAEHLGLLLQTVKDLWLGTVAVGGGASVGRGTLRGLDGNLELIEAGGEPRTLRWRTATPAGREHDPEQPGRVSFEGCGAEDFAPFQRALLRRLNGGAA